MYPEIYAFHFGKGRGSHAAFDFWPARREIMLSDDPCDLLDAINDRGITRLVVPNRPNRDFAYCPKEVDTDLDRIQSAFVYDRSGQVEDGTVRITETDRRTEINPSRVLRPVYFDKPKDLTKPFKESDGVYVAWLKLRAADVTQDERTAAANRRQNITRDGLVSGNLWCCQYSGSSCQNGILLP